MTKKPAPKKSIDMFAVLCLLCVFFLGSAIGAAVQHSFPPKSKPEPQCSSIAVTGTIGESTMALQGDDLYLTGVKAVRCAELPKASPAVLHGHGPSI